MSTTSEVTQGNEDGESESGIQKAMGSTRRVQFRPGLYGLPLALLALIAVFSAFYPHTFPTHTILLSTVSEESVLIILAMAAILPLRTGDFDLSIASTMILSASLVGMLTTEKGVGTVPAVIVALASGIAVGAVNAFFIVGLKLDAFVTTLGTMTVVSGIALGVTNTNVMVGFPHEFLTLSRQPIFGLPTGAYFGWIIALILWFLYQKTPLGRYLLVVGKSRTTAELAGLPVKKLRVGVFVAAGFLSAVAGIVLAGTIGAVDPTTGGQYLLTPYAAAFLGTATLRIGEFNVVGTIIGVYLLAVGTVGLGIVGVAAWLSEVFDGGALVAGILFAVIVSRRQVARSRVS